MLIALVLAAGQPPVPERALQLDGGVRHPPGHGDPGGRRRTAPLALGVGHSPVHVGVPRFQFGFRKREPLTVYCRSRSPARCRPHQVQAAWARTPSAAPVAFVTTSTGAD